MEASKIDDLCSKHSLLGWYIDNIMITDDIANKDMYSGRPAISSTVCREAVLSLFGVYLSDSAEAL